VCFLRVNCKLIKSEGGGRWKYSQTRREMK
jgi:hypothetical protein